MARGVAPHRPLDPVSLEIVWHRLIAVVDEAATSLVRTSFSPIVRESNDFSCVLYDARGNDIVENTIGIPSFNMTLGRTLRHVLRRRPPDRWRRGDVVFTNDPWIGAGHLPDITIVAPIYVDDRLLAWVGSIAHHVDVGGTGWSADASEVFEEGVRIPPLLLMRQGELNEDVLELISANVRQPDRLLGDLLAQVSAGEVAGQRLRELVRDAELTDLETVSDQICLIGEESMRRAVAAAPDGVYRAALDLDGTDDESIHVEVAVTIEEDAATVDYSGTSPQVRQGLNCPINYTEAYTCYPLKCVFDPLTPRNEGSYRRVTVAATAGSILNPSFPAAVNARHMVGHCLGGLVYQALAPALPERIIAESGSAPTMRAVISGARDDGSRFSTILFINGGMGAGAGCAGLSATCFPSNVISGAMEMVESLAPLRIWRKELAPDTGGAGEFPGGLGQVVEVELLGSRECTLSLFVERRWHPARGVLGGLPGAPSVVEWNGRQDGFRLKGRNRMRPGDRLLLRYPGGGGYGDPHHRVSDAVLADVESGVLTPDRARELYASGD
ncbi:MAG: hydantoinase B/oxoprolinase family protein [Chloroflexi bacterium]|nr:MAG: hydantoinase B/oxoprolinase family protein [Chloroflexota bacterium]